MKKGLLMLMALGFAFGLTGCGTTEKSEKITAAVTTEVSEIVETGEVVVVEEAAEEVVEAVTEEAKAISNIETTTEGVEVEVTAEAKPE